MELADQQNSEASGAVAGAEIPVSPDVESSPSTSTPASPATSPRPEKPLSLREQINKSVEAVRTEEAKRARAPDGKFTKLEAGAAEKPAAAADVPKPATDVKPLESNPEAPPSAWKGIWESMTPEARAIAIKRESEVAKGFDEYRAKAKNFEAVEQVLSQARARFQQQGIQNDAQALHNILSWEQGLSNPATRQQAYLDLGRQLGIDLSTLAQNPSPSQSYAQDIPDPIRPVIDQFGNAVQTVRQDLSAVQQEIQALRNERTSQEIAAFAKDKPHFDKVSALMGQLMMAGAATDLNSAYQQAVKIHPEVSAQVEAERVAKESADRERTQAEKAAAARRAAVSPPVRSPHGGAPAANQQNNGKGMKPRESILAAIAELREGQRA